MCLLLLRKRMAFIAKPDRRSPGRDPRGLLLQGAGDSLQCRGISEVVRTDETGWLIQKDDEAGFADAIENLLSSPDKAAVLTRNAFELVSTQFVNVYLAEKFAAEYRKVITRLSK